MDSLKKLLTFAHRGEAQAFFSQYTFKPVDFFFDGLFESDDYFLLITGEGPHNASEKTISVLALLSKNISEVINLGVAGSLSPKFKKNDLIWIRSSFAHHAERLEFKSFTSPLKSAGNDCMTAYTRVLSLEERKKLSHFANIVDRELWSIASAAQFFKRPFYALKIISDDLSLSPDASFDICQFVKEEAGFFSDKLLKEFREFSGNKIKTDTPIAPVDLLANPLFYFTTSQERKLISLIHSLKLKGVDVNSMDLSLFKSLEISPKDRTRHLLVFLNDELNPMAKKVREAIAKKINPLTSASIATSFDPDFEQDWLMLSIRIQSSRDLEKVKNALKIFSYEDFKNVLNGQID